MENSEHNTAPVYTPAPASKMPRWAYKLKCMVKAPLWRYRANKIKRRQAYLNNRPRVLLSDSYWLKPSLVIGSMQQPYLLRWHLIPRNRFFNVYLHRFCQSDDDRALHDHPWAWNFSMLLRGRYIEHTAQGDGAKLTSEVTQRICKPFRLYARNGRTPHRIELFTNRLGTMRPVWTIFITGSKKQDWGFYCPKGWRHHLDFLDITAGQSKTGRGCE